MKRARQKNKSRAVKHMRSGDDENIRPQITGEYDNDPKTQYDSIIDEIRREKGLEVKEPAIKSKKNRNFKKVFFVILAIFVLFGVLAMGTNIFDDDDILAPLEDGRINVLLVGVDESGLRTDAIMVASYDVNAGEINLLSVPRDTKVYITNKKATRKINAVHAMTAEDDNKKILGVQATAEAVTQLTGIPINYYVEFSFLSIDHLFDILGGVEYDIPDVEGKGRGMNYDDPYQNLHIHLTPGPQTLSGNQVQQFLRYRKSNYKVGTGSDTDRVKRQQDFIKAVIDQKLNIGIIPKIPSIYSQLSKEVKTNISGGDIKKYIRHFSKLSGEKISSYSLVGENKIVGGASYFVCNLAATKALISENFGIEEELSDQITLSGKNPQKPLIAGNMTKADTYKAEPEKKEEPPKTEEKKEEKKEEQKEVKEESKEEPEEDKNAAPPVEPNKTPLEEIYNLDE